MLPDFSRRSVATGAAFCSVLLVVACGEANKAPFFETNAASIGGGSGTAQGGASGGGTAGVAVGGDAGSGIGGGATGGTSGGAAGGDAGMAGTSGDAGSGATGGTGSGGVAGTGVGGVSGTNAGGSGGMPVDCSGADPAAVAFEGHCYVVRSTMRTWAAARDDCAEDGAHLVTIGSDAQSEAAFLAENQFVWTLSGATDVWIGATDGHQSNQGGDGTPYKWITGEAIVYDHWSSGQPNNSRTDCMDGAPCTCGDMCWEHCGFMWDAEGAEPATWNDRHCEHAIGYVCEWDEPPQ
jgi:hypothetical protein